MIVFLFTIKYVFKFNKLLYIFYLIDLINMRHMPDDEYHYIAHYMDHWPNFHIVWPLMQKKICYLSVHGPCYKSLPLYWSS